jgi:RNA polymerase sigma-70 factor (ECF subfamily)
MKEVRSTLPELRLVHGHGDAPEKACAPQFDDTQLLAAVRAGDTRAAAAIYERTRPVVVGTVRRLLQRADQEHEDLCQQVMVEVVRTIDTYRGECPFTAWVGLLAARVVYKNLRRRQLERRFLSDTLPPEALSTDQPARQAVNRSTIARIRKHLATLDRDRAWAFLLHDVHGYDLREMAQIMGASVSAAQSRLVRGRRDLHELIASDPDLRGELVRRTGKR